MTVLGLDVCAGRWMVVVAEALSRGIDQRAADTVVIDISIGLPDLDSREADKEARAFIQPQGPCGFPAPSRMAFEQPTCGLAHTESRAHHARQKALSKQAYALGPKILEVGAFVTSARFWVRDGHPELTFRHLSGRPPPRKTTAEGRRRRHEPPAGQGLGVAADLRESILGAFEVDLLNAVATAWTAPRVARDEAISLPGEPEEFSDGWHSAFWY